MNWPVLTSVGDYGRSPSSGSGGPIVVGGRIEVRSQGFALSVPDGWYGFDLSDPGLIGCMESYDPFTRGLLEGRVSSSGPLDASTDEYEGPSITLSQIRLRAQDDAISPPDAFFRLVAIAPWGGETAIHECNVVVTPMPRLDFDTLVELAGSPQEEYAETSSSVVDLPAGRAVHMCMSGGRDDKAHPACTYEMVRDGWLYSIHCVDDVRHEGQWRSIADSFEFTGGSRGRSWRKLMSRLLRWTPALTGR